MPVQSSKVLYHMHTGMSAVHILIPYNLRLHTCKDTYSLNLQYHVSDPVHHCEVHSLTEYPGRKVNLLQQVSRVVEALDPVSRHCTFLL